MGRILQNNSLGKLSLHGGAVFLQLFQHASFLRFLPDYTNENVTLAKIRGDIDRGNRNQNLRSEVDLPRNDFAQLPFEHFVNPLQSMFHRTSLFIAPRGKRGRPCGSNPRAIEQNLQLLSDLLQVVTLDDVADLVLSIIPEFNTALDACAHFFYVVLKSA